LAPVIEVRENPAAERYDLTVDGSPAGYVEYRGNGPVRALTHTEVGAEFAGRGLATELVRRVLDDLRGRQVQVLPLCPFVKVFLNDHREYLDMVQPAHRRAFNLPEPPQPPS
jgi:predicted GNAT family acetyltransferase